MSEQQQERAEFPLNWRIGQDFDPNDHLMSLKGRDYLNVQSRLLWFIRDQRALIVAGLATMPYIVRSELVEQDREAGWAHFKTYVRDVLGNEATQYGSESAKDFGDYAEKASTKSLGRALLALGYGTAFAPEMDEGERVVDSPVDRRKASQRGSNAQQQGDRQEQRSTGGQNSGGQPATQQQLTAIEKLCQALGKAPPAKIPNYTEARELLEHLSAEYQRARREPEDGAERREPTPIRREQPAPQPMPATDAAKADAEEIPANQGQLNMIAKLSGELDRPLPAVRGFHHANDVIAGLSAAKRAARIAAQGGH